MIGPGKQTVIPSSLHVDTGRPYQWTTERTLRDTPPEELSELTAAHHAAMIEVLKAHGWQPEPPRAARAIEVGDFGEGAGDDWRRVNDTALARLDQWIPKLGLARLRRNGPGYRAVASFRPSYSGKPDSKRELHLSIRPDGIKDYGDGERGLRAIDLAMAARRVDAAEALHWLAERVGLDLNPVDPDAARMAEKIIANAAAKRAAREAAQEQPMEPASEDFDHETGEITGEAPEAASEDDGDTGDASETNYEVVEVTLSDGSKWFPLHEAGPPPAGGWDGVYVDTDIRQRRVGFVAGAGEVLPWIPGTGLDENAGSLRRAIFGHAYGRVMQSPLRPSDAWVWAVAWAITVDAARKIEVAKLVNDVDRALAMIEIAIAESETLALLRAREIEPVHTDTGIETINFETAAIPGRGKDVVDWICASDEDPNRTLAIRRGAPVPRRAGRAAL